MSDIETAPNRRLNARRNNRRVNRPSNSDDEDNNNRDNDNLINDRNRSPIRSRGRGRNGPEVIKLLH
jgi:hypothetical protein